MAACAALTWLLYVPLGPKALVLCAPLFAVVLAAPILEAFGQIPYLARLLRYRGFHGRYFEYKGTQIVVHQDDDGHRWIELANVRSLLGQLPGDAQLARSHANAFAPAQAGRGSALRADALHDELRPLADARAIGFRNWLQREVIFPAQKARAGRPG